MPMTNTGWRLAKRWRGRAAGGVALFRLARLQNFGLARGGHDRLKEANVMADGSADRVADILIAAGASRDEEGKCTSDSSFLRTFKIVETVAAAATPMTLEAIADATGVPKSTVHRLLKVLVSSRILMVEAIGRSFAAGDRLYSLLSNVASNSSLHRRRREIIGKLVERLGHTCNFTTLAANDVVYVDRVEADWPRPISLFPGSHVPVHCTSSGKLLLSYLPARQRRRLLYQSALGKFTETTVTDPVRLEEELKRIRKAAVATDDGGYFSEMISVAVPVYGRNRKVIGTVAVHASRSDLPLDEAFRHLSELKQAARDLGAIYRELC
jgi:IclR family acetate operon transcriptional repressor